MEGFKLMGKDDLINNPTARVPICLCLDVSASMMGNPINELNRGVKLFYDSIKNDEIASYSAEISIVTFGKNGVECIADFLSMCISPDPPILTANGLTPMGEAVNMALDLLEQRKQAYKIAGVDYYQPWLVLMTDGIPNGKASELSRAIARTADLVNNRKLTVFPIGIGNDADMGVLARFSPKRVPLRLQGLKFCEFFAWLSKSVSTTSQSIPGESIKLDLEGIGDWGDL